MELIILIVLLVTFDIFCFALAQIDGRIVGGIDTTIEQHPYQLSVELADSLYCGASLIHPNVALTAAHCASYPPSAYRIRAGSTFQGTGGTLAHVKKICSHPKYANKDYDVSVFLLDRPFQLSSSIQTIGLQPMDATIPVGTHATVTGWGTLHFLGSSSKVLQEVQVPKVGTSQCRVFYPGSITARMTCYGYPMGGKDSCQGDSGGPLVVNGKQVGIVSFGEGCAFPYKPGVYTRLENREILQHIHHCLSNV